MQGGVWWCGYSPLPSLSTADPGAGGSQGLVTPVPLQPLAMTVQGARLSWEEQKQYSGSSFQLLLPASGAYLGGQGVGTEQALEEEACAPPLSLAKPSLWCNCSPRAAAAAGQEQL